MMKRARGLTLVELLVAVAIFGILSAFAYRALTVVLDSRGRIEQENRKWRELALFFARLEQDVATAVPRPVRDPGDVLSPALAGSADRGADQRGRADADAHRVRARAGRGRGAAAARLPAARRRRRAAHLERARPGPAHRAARRARSSTA